jgi:hypothetical protein
MSQLRISVNSSREFAGSRATSLGYPSHSERSDASASIMTHLGGDESRKNSLSIFDTFGFILSEAVA